MNNGFDLVSNLHLLFFVFLFLIDFILFHWGIMILLLAKGESERIQKGRRILWKAFLFLFIILLIVLVFYLISYFFKIKESLQPSVEALEEFPPPSHVEKFPPPPEIIDIGSYHFAGPGLLRDNQYIKKSAIYAILCKKPEKYSILYISETERGNLLEHEQYRCWLENCNQNLKNLYIAILWTPSEKYDFERKREIRFDLRRQIILPCFDEETLEP